LNFKDILEENRVETPERYIIPNPEVGGWKKFVKTNMTISPKPVKAGLPNLKKSNVQSTKKGWLHEK
jgi:hypothetical protein